MSCAAPVIGDSFAFSGFKAGGVPLEAWESTGCLLYTSDKDKHPLFKETGYKVNKGEFPDEKGEPAQALISLNLSLVKGLNLGDDEKVKAMEEKGYQEVRHYLKDATKAG